MTIMKKIYSLALLVLGLIATACDPMAKINKELDQKEHPVTKQAEYTLTKSDYSTLASTYIQIKTKDFLGSSQEKKEFESKCKKEVYSLLSQQAFNEKATANLLVPFLLKTKYPEWGKGSIVLIHYNLIAQRSENSKRIQNTDYIELDEATLKQEGFTGIRDFQDGSIEQIATIARKKGAKTETILVKLSFENDSRYVLIDGKLEADKKAFYVMQPEDYKAMSFKHDNFSSSETPDHYLPIFLQKQFPYAKERSSKVIVYLWYSKGETAPRFSEYVLKNGLWKAVSSIATKSDQFLHNGKEWLFDPTIVLTLGKEDFAILFDYVKNNHPSYVSKNFPANEEFWFGGSGYYRNFNLDGGDTVGPRQEEEGLSPEELQKVKEQRIVEGLKLLLSEKYPGFPAVVNGVDQYYLVNTVVRKNRQNEKRTYRLKGLGNNQYELAK